MAKSGKFITLEGGEGVGKSTNQAFIAESLRSAGVTLLETREPGGTALGEALRELLLSADGAAPTAMAELLILFAARAQHLERVIEPALAEGRWVLCDRFTDATFAYQGYGRNMPLDVITSLEALVQRGRMPDLTILLDVDPEIGMGRARARGALDRFEREDIAFFSAVRAGYLHRAELEPDRFRVIDAGQDLQGVQAGITAVLGALLG